MDLSDQDAFMVNVLGYPAHMFTQPPATAPGGGAPDGAAGGDATTPDPAAAPSQTATPAGPPPAPQPLPGPRVQQQPTGPTVSRDAVEQQLVKFLTQVQTNQGGRSVKIDQTVLLAGDVVAQGIPSALVAIPGKLKLGDNVPPAALAHSMASALPDQVPQENLDNLAKFSPKDPTPPAKSLGDVLGEQLESLIKKLPKDLQGPVRKAAGDAIAAGIAAAANAGMKQAGLDPQTTKALSSAIEAAIKQKGPMDRQQNGPGNPDAHPAPGSTPPSGPPAPGPPGETKAHTPDIPIPDTPSAPKPDKASP